MPKLLTVRQVAERLGLSTYSVYRRVERDEIPAVRLGSTKKAPIRVPEDWLEQWLTGERS